MNVLGIPITTVSDLLTFSFTVVVMLIALCIALCAISMVIDIFKGDKGKTEDKTEGGTK